MAACLAIHATCGAFRVRGGTLGRCVGFEPDYLLDHNQVLCRLSYHRHDGPTTDQSEPLSPNRPHGHRGGAACTRNLNRAGPARWSFVSVCAEGGRIELPRACASAVFKTVPVAIRRVGPPGAPARSGSASLLRRDSNPRPPHYECGAPPSELRSVGHGNAPRCRPCTRLFSSLTGFAAPAPSPPHVDGRRGVEPLMV